MAKYEYITGDDIVSTIQFDVLELETRETVKVNGEATMPSLDFLLFPSGLGFQQEVKIVSGDTIDYVLKQTIKKKNIKLTVMWKGENAYQKYKSFTTWISTYNNLEKYHIRFSYVLGGIRRYVELAVTNIDLKGRDDYFVSAELTMQPLTPFYERDFFSIMINNTHRGKIYNYAYPYFYGGGAYSDSNLIENDYLKQVPIKIILKGPMITPFVNITKINDDGTNGETYGSVQFSSSTSITENQRIIIDAFNNRVYMTETNLDTGATTTKDMFDALDKSKDSFLFANPGRSKITASLDNEEASCEVHYVRYIS